MLSGTLATFSLPDILQLLSHTGKSGRLELRGETSRGDVWFVEGQVRYATSSGRLALGRRLVGAGLLTTEALEAALERQDELRREGTGLRLGELLVEDGAIDAKTLAAQVREQVNDSVFDLLRWTEGDFSFDPTGSDELEDREPVLVGIAPSELVEEGTRRLQEWATVEQLVPAADAVVRLVAAPDGEEVLISRAEWRLVTLVDGRRTVADLVALTGQGDFHTARTLHGLVEAGLVEVVTSDGAAPALARLLRQQDLLALLDGDAPGEPDDRDDGHGEGGDEGADDDVRTAEAEDDDVAEAEDGGDSDDEAGGDVDDDLVHRLIAGVKNL